jgi:hypothetical protein
MLVRSSIILVLVLAATAVCADEVLDRMVATVNGHVILLSDLQDEVRFEAFTSSRPLGEISRDQSRAALDRLIDQELLREQMRAAEVKPPAREELLKAVENLKSEILKVTAGRTWGELLSSYHLDKTFVQDRMESEVEQLRFIDARFRPSIQVSGAEIDQYYKEQLVPKLPPSDPVTLSDAAPKIREILVQQKINQALSSWLETLRSQAQIQLLSVNFSPGPSPLQVATQ